MRSKKVLVGIAVLGFMTVALAPVAEAQCPTGRIFQAVGGMMLGNVRVLTGGEVSTTPGHEIGRFWDSANRNFSNNYGTNPIDPGDDTCPSSAWWSYNAAGNGELSGVLTGTGCAQFGCPGEQMTVVVENYDVLGPPGIGAHAYFIAMLVDETPADARWYNYARVNGGANVPWLSFPRVELTSLSRLPNNNVQFDATLVDVAPNTQSAVGAGDMPVAASAMIANYQLMQFSGMADPGRPRSLWTVVDTYPYQDSEINLIDVEVECDDALINDTWLAVGIQFDGGAGGPLDSALVGSAIVIECDPNLADPTGIQVMQPRRPSTVRQESEPGAKGRR